MQYKIRDIGQNHKSITAMSHWYFRMIHKLYTKFRKTTRTKERCRVFSTVRFMHIYIETNDKAITKQLIQSKLQVTNGRSNE